MNRYAVVETLKSIGRAAYFFVLGLISLILTVIATSPDVASQTFTVPVLGITLNVGAAIVAGVAALAKIVDRYRHKNPSTDSTGIAPKFLQR